MDDNFDAKFGRSPTMMPVAPHILLSVQFAICVVVLLALRPAFVLRAPNSPEALPSLSVSRILSVSLAAVAATVLLHACKVTPKDTLVVAYRGVASVLSS